MSKIQIVVGGDEKISVTFAAVCQNCTPKLTMPFAREDERDVWVVTHAAAQDHEIETMTVIVIE